MPNKDEQSVGAAIGVKFFVKEYISTATRYSYPEVEKILLLLYEYNLRNVGINDAGTDDAGLLKEMMVKIIAPL